MKINLLLIIPSLKNGGSERVFSYLANEINNEKFNVNVLVIDGSFIQYPIKNVNVRIYNLNSKGVVKNILRIIRVVRKIKPDIVLSTLTHLNLIMATIKPLLGKSRIGCRESSILSLNIANQKFSLLFKGLSKLFYRNFDFVICQSLDMYNDIMMNYYVDKNKLIIINNPIGFDKPLLNKRTPSKVINFITVGRVEKVKGYDRILRVLSRIDYDFIYTIVGDGSNLKDIKQLAETLNLKDRVVFKGDVKDPISLYQLADIYLHGSYYEGFPNSLLESLANGVPIVAFKSKGDIQKIVKNSYNGIVVNEDDDVAFRDAIKLILELGLDCHEIQYDAYNRFGKEVIIKNYEDFLIKQLKN